MLTSRSLAVSHGVLPRTCAVTGAFALLCALVLATAVFSPPAEAAAPSTVTVRVEGLNGETLLPQTQVTTATAAIPVEGGSCSGTSAGGALYDATHGNWKVKYSSEGVEIDGIEGLVFSSFAENPGIYWAFWLNGGYSAHGACSEEVSSGADIVFFAQCYATGSDCPTSATAPDHFLTSTAPTSSVVNVGEGVFVTVGSVATATGMPESSLPLGVTVRAGSVSATPGPTGLATLEFASAGTYTLQARGPDSVPSDTFTICVHNGNDGTCGTTAPARSPASLTPAAGAPKPYTGPFAVVSNVTGLIDGHVYGRREAPRLLAGTIRSSSAVASIRIELRREYRRRCYAYDGVRERFVVARCGTGRSFTLAGGPSFSYLLPAALSRGRYVLDVSATDAAGNRTALARGTSRIVFYVR